MRRAARGGHKILIDFFISKGANDWDNGMYWAGKGGREDLVEFFITKGANNLNDGIAGAARGGHKDLLEFLLQKKQINGEYLKLDHNKNEKII